MPKNIDISKNELPSADCNDFLTPRSAEKSPKGLLSRIEQVRKIEAKATPVAQGMYELETEEESYIINLDSLDKYHNPQPACFCDDFIFRASNDGFDCKHILYVKDLISNGFLPPVMADPEEWMNKKMNQYKDSINNKYQNNLIDTDTYHRLIAGIKIALSDPYNCDIREIEKEIEELDENDKSQKQQVLSTHM